MRDPQETDEQIRKKVGETAHTGYYTHPGEPDVCVICQGYRYGHEAWCIVGRLENLLDDGLTKRNSNDK